MYTLIYWPVVPTRWCSEKQIINSWLPLLFLLINLIYHTFDIVMCLLQGFRIDLTCKQLTVDFVNQSVLQMSSHDVEGKRSDKTDFAEKLGAMNRRWQILQGLIGEKVTYEPPKSRVEVFLWFAVSYVSTLRFYFRFSIWKDSWKVGWSMKVEFRP